MPDTPLFPEIAEAISDPPAKPCNFPYFMVAYWPAGKYWAIKYPLEGECIDDRMRARVRDLHRSGWRNITIMRLPLAGPWSGK